jgi:hypothetical protein
MHQLITQEMEEAELRPEPTNSAPRTLLPSQCENTCSFQTFITPPSSNSLLTFEPIGRFL